MSEDSGNTIMGSLKQQKLMSLTEMVKRKYNGERVPVKEETLEHVSYMDQTEMERYLSTVQGTDQVH